MEVLIISIIEQANGCILSDGYKTIEHIPLSTWKIQ